MMHKRKIVLVVVFILFAIVIAGYYLLEKVNGIDASELSSRGKIIRQSILDKDLDNDGKTEKIYLSVYQKNNEKSSYIVVKDTVGRKREKKLSGFEEDLVICPKQVETQNSAEIICLFGEVGVHSQNIQFLKYDDFSFVQFVDQDGIFRDNISCDVPYFDYDVNSTNNLEIYFDNRNYDKDPIVDINRIHYYFNNDVFIYKSSEQLSQEGSIK